MKTRSLSALSRLGGLVACVAAATVISLPNVASATLWQGWVRGSGALVLYTYDDAWDLLSIEWSSFPEQIDLPVTVSNGAMSILFYEDAGWLNAEIDLDLAILLEANPGAYDCNNHACNGWTCDQHAGMTCTDSDVDTCGAWDPETGDCVLWNGTSGCYASPCSGPSPGDPPPHLYWPFAIAPYNIYGHINPPPPPT